MINMFCYIHWFYQKVYYSMLKNEESLSRKIKVTNMNSFSFTLTFHFDPDLCTVCKNNEKLNPMFTFFSMYQRLTVKNINQYLIKNDLFCCF